MREGGSEVQDQPELHETMCQEDKTQSNYVIYYIVHYLIMLQVQEIGNFKGVLGLLI